MKLSLILEAIDRMSAPARKAKEAVEAVTDAAKPAADAIADVGEAVDRIKRPATDAAAAIKKVKDVAKPAADAIEKVEQAAKPAADAIAKVDRQVTRVSASTIKWTRLALRSADAIDNMAGRAKALSRAAMFGTLWVGIKAVEKGALGAGKAIGFAAGKAKELALWGARWGAVGVAAAAGWATFGMIRNAADFETMAVELERLEGSAEKAKRGLDWVRKFSWDATVPLTDLTTAFVTARKAGLDPMSGSLQAMLDKAIESKKGIDEIVGAMKDAKNFDYGGLDALGIKVDRKKGQLFFSWLDREGKRAVRTTRENGRAIEKTLSDIFTSQAGGASQAQARTLSGMWQRFKNMVSTFQLDVADAGIFDVVKAKLQALLDWVNAKAKDGSLAKWANNVSDQLEKMIEMANRFITDTNWDQARQDISDVAKAAWGLAVMVGRAVAAVQQWRYEHAKGMLENTIASRAPWVSDFDRGSARQRLGELNEEFGKRPKAKPYTNDQLRNGLRGYSRPQLAPPVSRPKTTSGKTSAAPAKGSIEVTIKTPPGTTARPTKVAATGMDLSVNTGRVAGAFA